MDRREFLATSAAAAAGNALPTTSAPSIPRRSTSRGIHGLRDEIWPDLLRKARGDRIRAYELMCHRACALFHEVFDEGDEVSFIRSFSYQEGLSTGEMDEIERRVWRDYSYERSKLRRTAERTKILIRCIVDTQSLRPREEHIYDQRILRSLDELFNDGPVPKIRFSRLKQNQ